jgi:hypothetical protein
MLSNMNSMPNFQRSMLTGAAADSRLDLVTGVRGSRSKIFLPTLAVSQQGFNSPGRLATPSAPGTRAWVDGSEELRLRLVPFGWTVPDDSVLNSTGMIISPDAKTAIVMVSGDGATGRVSYVPQVKYRRGPVAAECVQGSLFTGYKSNHEAMRLYFLLHEINRDDWHSELSLPAGISSSGRVTGWKSRIQIANRDSDSHDPREELLVPKDSTPVLPQPTVRWRDSA